MIRVPYHMLLSVVFTGMLRLLICYILFSTNILVILTINKIVKSVSHESNVNYLVLQTTLQSSQQNNIYNIDQPAPAIRPSAKWNRKEKPAKVFILLSSAAVSYGEFRVIYFTNTAINIHKGYIYIISKNQV